MSARPAGLGELLSLAWPIVVSRSTQVVIGLADAVMVAGLGKEALAATTTGAFNTFCILILPLGIVYIVSSFVSQLTGAGDRRGAQRYGWYGFAIAGATQVACLISLPFIGPVLAWTPYDAEVQRLMTSYLLWRLPSGGAAVGLEVLANYYGGLGNTVRPMIANLAAMALNVLGNALLIPVWGVAGAALASSLSTVVVFLVFAAIFARDGVDWRAWSGAELVRTVRFGVPNGLNWFFEFMAFNVFVNLVVADLGTTTLAAFMAVLQVNSVSFQPGFALGSAGAILVGQAIGADRKDDVPALVGLTARVAAGWQGIVSLFYLAIPGLLLLPFADDRAGASVFLTVGARMLRWSAAWQLVDGLSMTLSEALRAAGDTAFPMWARIVIAWGLFTPGAWVTIRWLGAAEVGVVLWIVAYLGILAFVLWWRFRSGAWRHIVLVSPGH